MENKSGECPKCGEVFSRKSNMYAHMRHVHKLKGQCDPVPKNPCSKTVFCSECDKSFTTKHNLQRHMQKMHNSVATISHGTRIKCPASKCEQVFSTYSNLRDHLVEIHQLIVSLEEIQFSSEKDFHVWKDKMQSRTISFYVADTSKKAMKDGTQKQYYNCHRSYAYRGSGKNKRRLKSAGSIKIGTTCPARLEVTIREGVLSVKFWNTHMGHSMDLEHIHLSKATRTEIAEKMKQGKCFQEILNEVYSGKLLTVDPQRALLIKRKDLHNIFRDFHIGSVTLQAVNDCNSSEVQKDIAQELDKRQEDKSLQHLYSEGPGQQQEINNEYGKHQSVDECQESIFGHCDDSSTVISENNGAPTFICTEIQKRQELPASDPILCFEEQHSQESQVLEITPKKVDYSLKYYEEIGTEDTLSDNETNIEKEGNRCPVVHQEKPSPNNNEIKKISVSSIEKTPLKNCNVSCADCGQMFTQKKNLYAHMRNIHKRTGDSDPLHTQKQPKNERCSLCGKAFTSKITVQRHRQKIHKEGIANNHRPRIRCPVLQCHEALSSYSHLREHLSSTHQEHLALEELHFTSEEDFLQWKDCVQADTISFYVLDTSKKKMKDGTEKRYYNCHRSYSYRRSGRNIRKMKSVGSSKIGFTCPARLEVIVQNGELDVKFWKTHLGHSMDIGHTSLSKAVRSEIAEILRTGASFEHVLNMARNGRLQANQSQRMPLIKRKDLHNICRDFHIAVMSSQSTYETSDSTWGVPSYPVR